MEKVRLPPKGKLSKIKNQKGKEGYDGEWGGKRESSPEGKRRGKTVSERFAKRIS